MARHLIWEIWEKQWRWMVNPRPRCHRHVTHFVHFRSLATEILGQINTPLSKTEWRVAHQAAREGKLPERLWTELYFQTAHDSSVAPEGVQTMSVFAQYVPYRFAEGTWDSRRDEVAALALGSIARHCENMPGAVLATEVLGPPDIEKAVGLTGGHIFQGECLPLICGTSDLNRARRCPASSSAVPVLIPAAV